MHRSRGFTLIELVVVIVILAILALAAAPKFINLSKDARVGTLEAAQGALRSGATMIYLKARVKNKVVGADSMTVDTGIVSLYAGYPLGDWQGIQHIINLGTPSPLHKHAYICDTEWCYRGNQTSSLPSGITTSTGRIVKIIPKGYSWNDECGAYYINHNNGSEPEIGIETSDC